MPAYRGPEVSSGGTKDEVVEQPRAPRDVGDNKRTQVVPQLPTPDPKPASTRPPMRRPGQRVKGWGHSAMAEHPQITAWSLTQSGMSDSETQDFSRGMTAAHDFVASQDTFGGYSSLLSPLRRKAMKFGDDAIRAQALTFIDNLARMTPERQLQLLQILQTSGGHSASELALVQEAIPTAIGVEGSGSGFMLTGDISSTDTAAAIRSLFPEIYLGLDDNYDITTTLNDISDAAATNFSTGLGSGSLQNSAEILREVGEGKRSAVNAALPFIGSAANVPNELAWKGWGILGRSNEITHPLTDMLDAGLAEVQNAVSPHLQSVLDIGLGSPDPNAPDYNPNYDAQLEQRMGAFTILAAVLPMGIGKVAGRLKIVRSAVSKEAAGAALSSRYRVPKPDPAIGDRILQAARAPATVVAKAVDHELLKFAKDPEAWFAKGLHGRQGRRFLDNLDAARAAHPDSIDGQVGFVHDVYGDQIPAGFVRNMLETGTREGAMNVFIDTIRNVPGNAPIIHATRKAQVAAKRISDLHDEITAARTNGVPENGTVIQMSATDVNRLADPVLWDPNTAMKQGGVGHLSREEFDALKADIARNGFGEPIEAFVDPRTGQAIMGEGFHRWRAATELGMEDIPVRVVYQDGIEGRWFSEAAKEIEVKQAALNAIRAKVGRRAATPIKIERTGGQIAVTAGENGEAGQVRGVMTADGDIEIQSTWVNKEWRSGGKNAAAGVAEGLYARLADEARAFGGRLISDDQFARTSGAHSAEGFWTHMREKGYPITQEDFGPRNGGVRWVWDERRAGQLGPAEHPEITKAKAEVTAAQAANNKYNPEVSPKTLQDLARARLELEGAEYKLRTTFGDQPMLELPKQSVIRSIVRQPTTGFQRAFHSIFMHTGFGPTQVADLAKTVDELATRPEMFVPNTKGNPVDAIDQNSATISTYMRRAGVDQATIQRRVGELAATKTEAEFYDVLEHRIFGEGGDIDVAVKGAKLDPKLREQIISLHNTAIDARSRSVLYSSEPGPAGAVSKRSFVLGKEVSPGRDVPMPSRPTEELNRVTLPSVDKIIEANSMLRKAARSLRDSKIAGSGLLVKTAWDVPRAILHVSTLLSKPLVMIVRLPAMAMRIQLEQGLRASSAGYKPVKGFPDGLSILPGGIPIPGTNHRLLSGLFGDDGWRLLAPDPRYRGLSRAAENTEMGMFMDIQGEAKPERIIYDTADINARRPGHQPKTEHYAAVRDELDTVHQDWLDREIARQMEDNPNVSPDDILAYIKRDPTRNAYLEGTMNPRLEGSSIWTGDLTAAQRTWLANRIAYMKQLTGSNPGLLHYAAHGRVKGPPEAPLPQQLRYASSVREQLEIRDEMTRLREEIRTQGSTPEREAALTALAGEKRATRMDQLRLEREYPGIGQAPARSKKKAPKKSGTELVQEEFEGGRYSFPEKIYVSRRFAAHGEGDSIWSDLERYAEGVSSTMYRGLRPLSYIDKHGTRGSVFTQANQRWTSRLETLGYSRHEAQAIAYVKAAKETRDLMYDLNARTSTQRALKDVFWFAPATQEVLYTWLVKIPAKQYWPIGMANLASKVVALKAGMEYFGLVQKDNNGDDVIVVKPVARMLDFLLPGKVPEYAYGKLSGLNLVTTGGGVPGLSVAANFAVGKAALKFGGVFKDISDVFQPYGPEAAILPQPITFLHEAVFGEAPPWEFASADYTKAQWDRANDMGIQYAYAELNANGIVPPRPEDYGTFDKKQDRWILTPEQEEAYKTDNKAYLDQLFTLGGEYAKGQAWVRLLGSTAFPMSLYSSSSDRDAWMKFWNEVIVPKGFGETGYSEEQSDLISQYIDDNPGSLGYATFYSQRNEKERSLPFGESQDDAFYDKYYTGERSTMSPEDYSKKLMATEARRFYQSQLDAKLKEISPSGDPWELLTSGFEKTGALTEYRDSWNRYTALNPEAAFILDQQSRLWRESKDIPEKSYEAERISNALTSLRDIVPMLTGEEGIRPEYVRQTMAEISALYSESGEFGAPTTAAGKSTAWWFDNVMDPYIQKTTKLYEEADRLTSLGQDAGSVYDQIRQLSNEAAPRYNGQKVPSVEEVFFGNKSPEEQEVTVNGWTTRPLEWLSDFQRKQVGYKISPAGSKFLDDYAQVYDYFYDYVNSEGLSPGSNAYDRAERQRTEIVNNLARTPEQERLLALTSAAPYVRLDAQGFGKQVGTWQGAVNLANYATQYIEGEKMSVKGFSVDVALPTKIYFYNAINEARANDSDFDQLLDDLSLSLPLPGGQPREGATLYEAVFFGNFRATDIPEALTSIGDGA